MSERTDLLSSIASTIQDYRSSEVAKPTAKHVDGWISQFDAAAQVPILREMDHVLKRTYFSLEKVTSFLSALTTTEKLVGKDSCAFWRSVTFLDIQGGGNSQSEMRTLFGELVAQKCGIDVDHCTGDSAVYVYLDDAIFTGNRVRRDLETWIRERAPAKAVVHVVTIALHSGGQYYANDHIAEAANSVGKQIDIKWWRAIELEDRKAYSYTSDVLRPTTIPNHESVQAFVDGMQYKPTLRQVGGVSKNNLFSSEEGRHTLEQEFLKAGAHIRVMCPNLGKTQRPLGHMTLDTLGFGSLIVTFRNCPNNAPLALWVGDPWYPLFPRTINSRAAIQRLFADLTKGVAK